MFNTYRMEVNSPNFLCRQGMADPEIFPETAAFTSGYAREGTLLEGVSTDGLDWKLIERSF